MIKYEFMRAHGKGSEGSEKRGGGAKEKRGGEKKGGARSTGTPPVYATDDPLLDATHLKGVLYKVQSF